MNRISLSFTRAVMVVALAASALLPGLSAAAEPPGARPFRGAVAQDFNGIWRQVDAVQVDAKLDFKHPWYTGPQLFWLFPDGFKNMRLTSEASSPAELEKLIAIWRPAPVIQKVEWRGTGLALFRHPETPPQATEIGLYLRDANPLLPAGRVSPRKGDMIIVYYMNGDPSFYRLLRYHGPG